MCRSIHALYNISPPASEEEIHAASLQYVRKISGFNKPSKINQTAFNQAVDEVAAISSRLIAILETNSPPRNRELKTAPGSGG